MTPLERITERVTRLGDPDDPSTPRPLLSIGEFFDGNEVVGSIGCNLPGEPSPSQLRAVLDNVARRPDVKDVRVRITAFDNPEWPFADTVFIMTTAEPEEVAEWFPEDLAPDEHWEGFHQDEPYEPYTPPAGYKVVACWWD
jgi:hypothetical protein